MRGQRMDGHRDTSPVFLARVAGSCQLLEAITATFGQVIVLGRLNVAGNAATTAANILGHERLFRLGFASSVVAVAFHLAWALLMFELLKVVNRRLSLFAIFIILIGCAMQALTALLYLGPLLVLQGGNALAAFTPAQLRALAVTFLKLNAYAFDIHVVFFGMWCVLTGYLIFKSTFLPRILGILFACAGVGWMLYLSPPLAVSLFMVIAFVSAMGEVPLELWLIVKGVNAQRWKEQASQAAVGPTVASGC